MNNQSFWVKALRWLAVIPALIAAYIIATEFYFTSFHQMMPKITTDIRYGDGFNGHYILGPIVLVGSFFAATFCSVATALYTAPSHKGYTAIFLGVVYLALTLVIAPRVGIIFPHNDMTSEDLVKATLQFIAHSIGFGAATYAMVFAYKPFPY